LTGDTVHIGVAIGRLSQMIAAAAAIVVGRMMMMVLIIRNLACTHT
jgi:hypothetical protein